MMNTIGWMPDKTAEKPLHKQIRDFIIQQISGGTWYPGYQLPTQRELAEGFQVNRSTVKAALEDLTADGILETRGKSGTYVKSNTWSLFHNSHAPDWIKYLQAGNMHPNRPITHSIHDYEFESDFIRLSTGELSASLLPKKALDQVLRSLSASEYNLNYNHPKGLFELRRSLADYYATLHVNVKPSQILIVSGALQAIYLISVGLLPKGASVLCEQPSYLSSLNVFDIASLSLHGIQSAQDGLDLQLLDQACRRKTTKILYTIPYFQNPSGAELSAAKRYELLHICNNHRLPIIEDDTYRELYFNGTKPLPLKAEDRYQSIIHVGSISKNLCAGLRLGWMIGQEEVINKLADLKMQIDYGASTLSQLVLHSLLESGQYQHNLERLRGLLKEKRDYMLACLDKEFQGLAVWNKPSGGFYIWLRILADVDLEHIFQTCIQHGVLINPGYMYDKKNKDAVRLSFSYATKEEIAYGLRILKGAIQGRI